MMHLSSGVVDPTNPLACTCHSTIPEIRRGMPFFHGCGIGKAIIATNTYCGTCTKFNCLVAGHTI